MELPSPRAVLLPKLPPVDLCNALITRTVSHTALLLIKELTPQKTKRVSGPLLMEFTSLTVLLMVQKKPA